MTDGTDAIARYLAIRNCGPCTRIVLVEGSSDAELFATAARLECKETGKSLLSPDLCVLAAGEGPDGGTHAVVRELIVLRGMTRVYLLPNGRPRYRVIALFDNDPAGKRAIASARSLDTSMLEFKDLFRLWPIMSATSNLDAKAMQAMCERENSNYKGLDWEIEDLIPSTLLEAFLLERPSAVIRTVPLGDKVHREFTRDGKAQLHRFIKMHAIYADFCHVIRTLRVLRTYLGITDGLND